jgi:hypothetical protein
MEWTTETPTTEGFYRVKGHVSYSDDRGWFKSDGQEQEYDTYIRWRNGKCIVRMTDDTDLPASDFTQFALIRAV